MFIICLFSDILSDFKTCFGLNPVKFKNCGNVCHNLAFLDVTSTCFLSLVHACALLYVTLPQKQVTNVSLVLKDNDMDSVNLSLLIRPSVSDGKKTDSSKVVSVIGI